MQLSIKVMNPPRPGKKCLVLDIDYTLFDHRSTVEVRSCAQICVKRLFCADLIFQNTLDLMRPYLHEFLVLELSLVGSVAIKLTDHFSDCCLCSLRHRYMVSYFHEMDRTE